MIPRDEEFDVFVSEGALVEVWRGERLSVAQRFGADWDGPVHSMVHAAAFCPPPCVSGRPLVRCSGSGRLADGGDRCACSEGGLNAVASRYWEGRWRDVGEARPTRKAWYRTVLTDLTLVF